MCGTMYLPVPEGEIGITRGRRWCSGCGVAPTVLRINEYLAPEIRCFCLNPDKSGGFFLDIRYERRYNKEKLWLRTSSRIVWHMVSAAAETQTIFGIAEP